MSAPVAITAAATAGQTPAGNAWTQGAATPAAGFEALLAALFPATPTGPANAGKTIGFLQDAGQDRGETTAAQSDDPAAAGADSALQAQIAALLAMQPTPIQPATTATPASADTTPSVPAALALSVKPEAAPATTDQPLAPQASAQAMASPSTPAPAAPPAAIPAAVAAPPPPAAPDQPLVLPAADPKAPPAAAPAPAVLASAAQAPALPLAEGPAAAATEGADEPVPAVTAAAAAAELRPAAKAEKPEASAPAKAASAPAAAAPAIQAETAAAAQPAQPAADDGQDRPPSDQHESSSGDKGAPDIVAAPASGPASAAHMIQAEAAAAAVRGAPETVARLAAQIVKKLEGKSSRFDIALDPAGLGKVDVKVEINAQGQMTAALNFDTAAAAAELRGRASELRAALEQAGFDMSNSNLSFSFAGQGDNSGQAFAQQDGRRGAARFLQALADDQPLAAPAAASSLLGSRASGVDVRI